MQKLLEVSNHLRIYSLIQMKALKQNPNRVEPEPQLSGIQIGKLYGVTDATVRRWRRDGLPCVWYNSKLCRYRVSEVDAWLRARGQQPRAAVITPQERKKQAEAAEAVIGEASAAAGVK
jgi:hypothetical protein